MVRGIDADLRVLIDAPVSGGVPRARTGELAIMVGGDGAAIDKAMPVLQAMGGSVLRTGDLGFVEDGELMGYGVIHASREGFKIGPLFAHRAEVADALLRSLAAATG